MSKTLIAYFSASGITKKVAEKLAKEKNGQLYEIKPETPYTQKDLDWNDNQSRSTKEMNDPKCRPKMITGDIDVAPFTEVYIGFPIWWYVAPRNINTFLEAYDFKGKNLHLFATSGSSTIDKSLSELKKTYPELNFVDAKKY